MLVCAYFWVVIVDVDAWVCLLVCPFCKCDSGAVIGMELRGILAVISHFLWQTRLH